jgi:hypothetical protein
MNDPDPNTPSGSTGGIPDYKAIDDSIRRRKEEFPLVFPKPVPPTFIPADVLDQALACAALPAFIRNAGHYTVDICEVVADLKAARALGKNPSAHISRLLDLIGGALANEEWTAIDDFAAAWEKLKGKPCNAVYGGEDYPFSELPDENDPKRMPLGWIVVDCVRQAQRDLRRIPSRGEVLEYVTFYRPDEGMDEAELSRQLKKLDLARWIPKSTKSASKAAAEHDAAEED